jgi:hypothetical protein
MGFLEIEVFLESTFLGFYLYVDVEFQNLKFAISNSN